MSRIIDLAEQDGFKSIDGIYFTKNDRGIECKYVLNDLYYDRDEESIGIRFTLYPVGILTEINTTISGYSSVSFPKIVYKD